MSKKQSTQLTAFYQSYRAWLGSGAPVSNPVMYRRDQGLCSAMAKFNRHTGLDPQQSNEVLIEMKQQFIDAGLDRMYPWGFSQFEHQCEFLIMHKDPLRTTWVLEHSHG